MLSSGMIVVSLDSLLTEYVRYLSSETGSPLQINACLRPPAGSIPIRNDLNIERRLWLGSPMGFVRFVAAQ